MRRLRLGRIGYANVLPIYNPIESGEIPCDAELVSGSPAELNKLFSAGELDVSATSSIEYARSPGDYLLVPDLAIGSAGPVMSVLLLSRLPLAELGGREVLVTSQTNTSAALLSLILDQALSAPALTTRGDISARLAAHEPPTAFLAIGDEALRLRHHPLYPQRIDLGRVWLEMTGLPFIFGIWMARADSLKARPGEVRGAVNALLAAKKAGIARLDQVADMAGERTGLSRIEAMAYFRGLVYDLGEREQAGLARFYELLARAGTIPVAPGLRFLDPGPEAARAGMGRNSAAG